MPGKVDPCYRLVGQSALFFDAVTELHIWGPTWVVFPKDQKQMVGVEYQYSFITAEAKQVNPIPDCCLAHRQLNAVKPQWSLTNHGLNTQGFDRPWMVEEDTSR